MLPSGFGVTVAGLAAAGLGSASLVGAAEAGATEIASLGAIAAGSLQLFLLQQLLSFRKELGELKGRVDSVQAVRTPLPRRKHTSQSNSVASASSTGGTAG